MKSFPSPAAPRSMMSRLLPAPLLALALLCAPPAPAQGHDPAIEGWISEVSIDSLTSFVRVLSGEDSVVVGGAKVLIRRRAGVPGNDLAADYVKQTFEGYGLAAHDHVYRAGGRNVYAVQEGAKYPERQFIVCAHYDGVTDYCADDNASGTAAVLEIARILSKETFDYTLVYAAWDEEELGLVGSSYYAAMAAGRGDDIRGVLNLDMLSWDSNGDGMCDVHTRDVGSSSALAGLLVSVDSAYGLGLEPVVRDPGTGASDHASFWNRGYGAILLIEAYYGGDFIPYYHTPQDRVGMFNLPYYLAMARVAMGTFATLAAGGVPSAVTVGVSPKWNLVSLPIPVADDTASHLFPGAVTGAFAFTGGASYEAAATLVPGKGYWMKFDSSASVTITGSEAPPETLDVSEGWNLVGAGPEAVAVSAINSLPPGLTTSQFFGYEGRYRPADTLLPGKGYWVKAAIAGRLVLPGTAAAAGAGPIAIVASAEEPPPPPGASGGAPVTGAPVACALEQNYPNPFNPSTRIAFSMPEGGHVRISILNVLGEEVRRLVDEERPAGANTAVFEASGLPGGVYLCRMTAGDFTATRKMVLMK